MKDQFNNAFITLYSRDLKRLRQQIGAYTSETALWVQLPGTINSGGNLCQHLIGNLRTYVCLTLGGYAYTRDRDAEFNQKVFSQKQLLDELDLLHDLVIGTLTRIDGQRMQAEYPRAVLDLFPEQTVGLILSHLLAHLSWHLGQINYHRRWVTQMQSAQQ